MRGFDARGSWRAGRPPDLFDGRRWCRGGKFRLLWCAAGSGGDMQDFRAGMFGRGSWRAGRPPDLFDGRKRYRSGNFRLLRCAVGSGGDMQAAAASLPLGGAGGPVALQTSPPVRRPSRAASFSACGPSGLTLPGCARQLLNRRSGSARLRSTASQLLLAALRNAKQSSHMRSRR